MVFDIGSIGRPFVAYFMEVIYGVHAKIHLMHFGLEFGIELVVSQKYGSLVEENRVVDREVVYLVLVGLDHFLF